MLPDGTSFEQPVKGYATGLDGTLGVVGRLETRDSALIAKAFLTGLVQEASAAFGLAKSAVVVTTNAGGFTQPFTGVQNSIQQISQYFLEQARMLGPVLWAESNTPIYAVLQEGLSLDGLPLD